MTTSACRLDMHVQPRFNPLARIDFFADQRSARPLVEGTVARGDLRADTYFYTGKIDNNPGDYFPFPVDETVLARGRERFNVFCAPCQTEMASSHLADFRENRRPITLSVCAKLQSDTSSM